MDTTTSRYGWLRPRWFAGVLLACALPSTAALAAAPPALAPGGHVSLPGPGDGAPLVALELELAPDGRLSATPIVRNAAPGATPIRGVVRLRDASGAVLGRATFSGGPVGSGATASFTVRLGTGIHPGRYDVRATVAMGATRSTLLGTLGLRAPAPALRPLPADRRREPLGIAALIAGALAFIGALVMRRRLEAAF